MGDGVKWKSFRKSRANSDLSFLYLHSPSAMRDKALATLNSPGTRAPEQLPKLRDCLGYRHPAKIQEHQIKHCRTIEICRLRGPIICRLSGKNVSSITQHPPHTSTKSNQVTIQQSDRRTVTKKTAGFPGFYPLRLSRRSGDY
jgi:hypothetical protein